MSLLVSVIIPTYNRAELIGQCLDSVLAQTYKDTEIIVVDDGSMDDTQAKLRAYGSRIRVINQRNAGAAAARNRGIVASRGEIIAFQDSDDQWRPTKLQRQVELLEKLEKSIPCCLCNSVLRTVDGMEYTAFEAADINSEYEEGVWLNVAEVLATRFVLFNQAVAIRRDAIERVGMFDESLDYLEDYDLLLRLALDGPWAFIREPLVLYREHTPESCSKEAIKDPVALKRRELKIFGDILAKVGSHGKNVRIRRQLRHRMTILRRGLTAARLNQADRNSARLLGKSLAKFDHLYYGAFSRSPWFPKASVLPALASSNS
jgi:glycosyltransferase involved in cell wall biosynthesis